jgi:hypothetical protein
LAKSDRIENEKLDMYDYSGIEKATATETAGKLSGTIQ